MISIDHIIIKQIFFSLYILYSYNIYSSGEKNQMIELNDYINIISLRGKLTLINHEYPIGDNGLYLPLIYSYQIRFWEKKNFYYMEQEYSFILPFYKKVLIKTNAIQFLYILCKCITMCQLYINYKILLNIYKKK